MKSLLIILIVLLSSTVFAQQPVHITSIQLKADLPASNLESMLTKTDIGSSCGVLKYNRIFLAGSTFSEPTSSFDVSTVVMGGKPVLLVRIIDNSGRVFPAGYPFSIWCEGTTFAPTLNEFITRLSSVLDIQVK